ncbi:MAG: hypothetical protein GX786_04645 [Clostridiales bacterium]|nr:hypothetical protein [Clostridiales bacterium]
MGKARSMDVVRTAIELVTRHNPPTYGEMDCQAFVEYCVNLHGSPKINYRGSNDMIRNACSWVGTIAEAKQKGYLKPGVWLFILERNGGEPDKYKGDGIGDASHVGMYTNTDGIEVVHSSASRGKVAISTLKNAWNMVGVPKDVAFDWLEEGKLPVTPDIKPPTGNTYPTLRKGSTGSFVAELQQRLLDLGYDIGKNTKIDGKFGEKTEKAVKAFQKRQGLKDDGIAGKDTWSALVGAVEKPPDMPQGGYDGAAIFDKITEGQFDLLKDYALSIGVNENDKTFGNG